MTRLPKPYYQDESVAIYHGDCREILPLIPDKSVDLVLTDPPFSIPVKYEASGNNWPRSWGDLLIMEPFFSVVFKELKRTLRGEGHCYIHCDGESYPIFHKIGYPLWPQSQLIIWYKPTGRRGRGWLHSYELVYHPRSTETAYAEGFRQDVVGIMPTRTLNRQHPAEKPGDLLSFLIEAYPETSNVLLLDPFLGSGTTLYCAKKLGRKAIGIEIEEKYCAIAADRCRQAVMLWCGQ